MRRMVALIIFLICTFCFTPLVFAQEVTASEQNKLELSFEQAVRKALAFNNELEKKRLEMEKADDARVSVPATYYINYSPEAEAGIFTAESTHFAYENAKKAHEIKRDALVLEVTKKYYDVLCAQEKLEAKNSSYAHAEAEFKTAGVMFDVGMISRLALEGAGARLNAAGAELVQARADLDNAYLALNQLVGYRTSERPVLTDTVSFEPLSLEMGDYESRALGENPSLEIVREAARYMERVQNYTTQQGTIAVTPTDVEVAKLDAGTARDGVIKLVHNLYSGARTLEETYVAAERGLAIAEETLRIARLKCEVGLATRAEVLKAEADLAAAEQKLFDLTAQHTYMKMALEKPWAYMVPGTP